MGRHTDEEPPRGYGGGYGDHRGRDDRGYDRGQGDYRGRDNGGHAERSYGRDADADSYYGRRDDHRDDHRAADSSYRSTGYDRADAYDRSGKNDRSGDYDRSGGYERSSRDHDDPYGDYDYTSSRSSSGRAAAGSASVGSASVGAAKAKGSASVEDVQAERMSKMEASYEKHGGTRRKNGRRRPGDDLDDEAKAVLKKKRRRKKILIAAACVVLMLTGVGIVGGTMYFESVPLPQDIAMPESNAVMFADNKTEMARIGSAYREKVDISTLPKHVRYAIIAAEDQSFYDNSGVDFKGVLRAVWNNVTGGDKQGASTITQQYAGIAAQFRDESTYGRKIQEAVMAMKLDDEYSKDDILGFYMNLVPFGRTAEGIGAASKAFFGKEAKDLTPPEAALLAGQIKSPDGAFDPQDPKEVGNAQAVKDRWDYVLDSMVKIGELPQAERDTYTEVPKTLKKTSNPANVGLDKDTGFVSHGVVLDELLNNYGIKQTDLESKGGYTIITSIDPRLQKAAREAASTKGEVLSDQKKNLRAALVAVDPTNGEIVAYYGGSDNGAEQNRAGYTNMHAPGSSFKMFTMLTALEGTDKKGAASINSLWDGSSPVKFDDRDAKVHNSEDDNSCGKDCKMINAIRKSLNTPTYSMTRAYGAENVVDTARKMGITQMIGAQEAPCESKQVKLEETPKTDYHNCFDNEVGFGQYEVSVQDMAAAFATLANKGERFPAHVIRKVMRNGEEIQPTKDLKTPIRAVSAPVAQDATYVMKTIHPNNGGSTLPNGSDYAGKSGTWERFCDGCDQNSQNWYAAFVPQLAAAAWLGDKDKENGSLESTYGSPLFGSQVAGDVWWNFMSKAVDILKMPSSQIQEPSNTGSDTNGDHATPVKPSNSPSAPPAGNDDPTPPPGSPSPEPGSPSPSCNPWLDPNCKDNGQPKPGG